jgi:polygalacturonase
VKKLQTRFLVTWFATPLLRAEPAGWSQVPGILARSQAPAFPARDFVITNYGAVADNQTDCTAAIGKAIDACVKAGGGHVVIPAGEFLTGPIHLQSDVDWHLDKYATIIFSTNSSAYLPAVFSRFESIECYNVKLVNCSLQPAK